MLALFSSEDLAKWMIQGLWESGMVKWIAIIIVVGIILNLLRLKTASKPKNKNSQQTEYKYQKRAFLTNNELRFYGALTKTNISKNFAILAKVRLADLIEPLNGTSNKQASFNKIKSKHIDFVLCDKSTLNPLLAIELDDSSHDRQQRQDRDDFVDQALESIGLPILHTRSADKLEENIMAKISPKKTAIKK